MTPEQNQEQFSFVFLRAIAASAQVLATRREIDSGSVDFEFSTLSISGESSSPKVEVQVKSLTKPNFIEGNLRYPLPIKNDNDLVGKRFIPRYLIVVVLPKKLDKWIKQGSKKLALYGEVYWVSLETLPEIENTTSKTIVIPKTQIFNRQVLRNWLRLEEQS